MEDGLALGNFTLVEAGGSTDLRRAVKRPRRARDEPAIMNAFVQL